MLRSMTSTMSIYVVFNKDCGDLGICALELLHCMAFTFAAMPVDASMQIGRQAKVRGRSDVPSTSHRPGQVTRAVLGPSKRHSDPHLTSSPMARLDVIGPRLRGSVSNQDDLMHRPGRNITLFSSVCLIIR
jgi:hypothetical protein